MDRDEIQLLLDGFASSKIATKTEKQLEGIENRGNDPVWLANVRASLEKQSKDPKCVAARKAGLKKFYDDPNRVASASAKKLKTRLNNPKKNSRTIVTPLGTFPIIRAALIAHSKKANNRNWLTRQIKNDPDNFYYLDEDGKKIEVVKVNKKHWSSKTVVTPLGEFSPTYEALLAHGRRLNDRKWLADQIQSDPKNYYLK